MTYKWNNIKLWENDLNTSERIGVKKKQKAKTIKVSTGEKWLIQAKTKILAGK